MQGATASSRALPVMHRSRACAARSAPLSGRSGALSSTLIMSTIGRSGWTCGYCSQPLGRSCLTVMHTERINFLDVHFDRLTFDQVKGQLRAATRADPYSYVVTPNVDHVICIHR